MGEKRSGTRAQAWDQLDLLPADPGVGARQGQGHGLAGGGGYLNGCTPSKVGQRRLKKIAKNFSQKPEVDPREASLLDELDAMGLSSVMLNVARTIGFDNFMAMWRILDGAHEAISENDSGIYIRLQRLSAYRRYQRNRFIEAMAGMGMSHPEISWSVKRDLGEEVSDRHIWRLMAGGRVKR
jgi:hypothetical protein